VRFRLEHDISNVCYLTMCILFTVNNFSYKKKIEKYHVTTLEIVVVDTNYIVQSDCII